MATDQIITYVLLGVVILLIFRKSFLRRGMINYTATEAKEKVKSGSILLDVRSDAERRTSAIPASIHIPLHELASRKGELEIYRDRELICYCASGSRSVSAALKLKKDGFTVANLTGGISSWNFSKR